MYCCQYTTQNPEKISRNRMKRGFVMTVQKLRAVSATLGGGASPLRRGSRKNSSTPKNIKNTLRAAMRKTFSVLTRSLIAPARHGPAAPPTFSRAVENE